MQGLRDWRNHAKPTASNSPHTYIQFSQECDLRDLLLTRQKLSANVRTPNIAVLLPTRSLVMNLPANLAHEVLS